MRHHSVVKDEEYPVAPGCPLVSVTDPQGRITFCNAAFVSVSGYARRELLGQPHDLIHHPDMPAAVGRQLWLTVRYGQVWTGVLKHRRKDGRFYWLRAHVSPITDEDRVLGYLSIRTPVGRQDVEAAAAMQQALRAASASITLPPATTAGRATCELPAAAQRRADP